MADKIQDTDLLLVNRGGQSYKAKRASTNVTPGSFTITLPDDVDPDWETLN